MKKDKSHFPKSSDKSIIKRSTFYHHGFFVLLTLLLLSCFIILFLLMRGNYFASLKQAFSEQSYDYTNNASYVQRQTQFEMLPERDVDIVFAGDSITARFEWDEYFTEYTVANRGIDSDVSEGLYNRLDTIISQNPEKIFLMIGINDIRQNIPQETTLEYYSLIVEELKSRLPDCRIYIQSVLPVNTSTGIENSRVQTLNSRLADLAADNGLTYIDLYSHMTDSRNNFPYTVDGVHPTGEGYQIWVDILQDYVSENPANHSATPSLFSASS